MRWIKYLINWVLDFYESLRNSIVGQGFQPDWHYWNFKNNLAHYIVPRLKGYKQLFVEEKNSGIVAEFVGREEEWMKVLDTIIFAFEYEVDISVGEKMTDEEIFRKRKEGLQNFAKYYDDLWD